MSTAFGILFILAIIGIGLFLVGLVGYGVSLAAISLAGKFVPNPYLRLFWAAGPLTIAFLVYSALYPGDDFYLGEFKRIAEFEDVSGIDVVFGSASYPVVHGDYCSSALLRTDEKRFSEILDSLKRNKNRPDTNSFGCAERDEVLRKTNPGNQVILRRGGRVRNDHFLLEMLPGNYLLSTLCNT